MRRVVSVWLSSWSTDRLRKQLPLSTPGNEKWMEEGLVTFAHDGRRLTVAAADERALAQGIRPGMGLTQARSLMPGLMTMPADPSADLAGLHRLAAWCLRYAPLVATDPPDGLWLDITGCAHLIGGEAALLEDLTNRLKAAGFAACAAAADTPGAAHALARHAAAPVTIASPGATAAMLSPLSVVALQLEPEITGTLHRLGLERIGQLAAQPRAPLARRFGPVLVHRLDQALGTVFEPIIPLIPPETIASRLDFVEPLLTAEAFAAVIGQLTETVCAKLEKSGAGARRLDLLFRRVDGSVQAIRIGTVRPSRDAQHLARMLTERLETVDPGLGVETIQLVVSRADRLVPQQSTAALAGEDPLPDVAALVDRLANRLGTTRIWRIAPVESDVPERALRRAPAIIFSKNKGTEQGRGKIWPPALPRPTRLFSPPQPVDALALLPDRPPVAFTWRRRRFRVRRADGPERIHGEWWRKPGEEAATRDYWRVEDEDGRRFWLYRDGDGDDPDTGDLRWFLHGIF
ncbi:MAG: Y-family DNA polymerase [Acetobacteraceae bacterium]